jgi:ABC-2 type transport system permease protein
MRNVWIVFKREFLAYFTSPLAYVLIIIFCGLSIGLTMFFGGFIEAGDASLASFFWFHPWIYMIFGPAIGMRLWSEEHRMGTTELLLTMPISPWQAILGKYLAALSVLAATLLCTLGMVITVNDLGDPDNLTILSGYIGSFLVGAATIALTCAISAITRNQITCVLISVIICVVLTLIGMPPVVEGLRTGSIFGLPLGWLSGICSSVSFLWHLSEMSRGHMVLQSPVYLLSVIGFSLFLTSVIIRSKRA